MEETYIMLKVCRSFFNVFFIGTIKDRLAIFWTLVIPIVVGAYNQQHWFEQFPTDVEFLVTLSGYWAFMILSTAVYGVGMGLLSIRDNGFLKMFRFIAGSIKPVVVSMVLSQAVFLCINLFIFTLLATLVFKVHLIATVPLVSVLVGFVALWPAIALTLWLPVLPVRSSAISPIHGFVILGCMVLASMELHSWLQYVSWINPAALAIGIAKQLFHFAGFLGNTEANALYLYIVIFLLFLIGLASLRYIRINSVENRN